MERVRERGEKGLMKTKKVEIGFLKGREIV